MQTKFEEIKFSDDYVHKNDIVARAQQALGDVHDVLVELEGAK